MTFINLTSLQNKSIHLKKKKKTFYWPQTFEKLCIL